MSVLLPKVNGKFRVIGIVGLLFKTVSGVINFHIGRLINYQYVLHGFWLVQGMGTASLKANLIQNLMAISD